MEETINQNANPIKAAIILMMGLILLITILASYFGAKARAYDQIRVSDVQLIKRFLQAYKTNEGSYPSVVNGMPGGWQKYLEALPVAPKAGKNCSEDQNKYKYSTSNEGQDYNLTFCLGGKIESFNEGLNTVKP